MTDQELLRQFEERSLPVSEWTHRAHVKVAYLYLRAFRFDEALLRISAGIRSYNAARNVPEGPDSGYNQTTTHAFLHLVAATMNAYDAAMPTATADEFCDAHPQLMTKHVLRLFYSPQRRMHPAAKAEFVEPDLCPLPTLGRSQAEELLRAYVTSHNAYVRARNGTNFNALIELFAPEGVMEFSGIPFPALFGRAEIAAAFQSHPPDDEIEIGAIEADVPPIVIAQYWWRHGAPRPAGTLELTTSEGRIGRLIVRAGVRPDS